jgi:DNA-binding HxlR family transcriptional regulator
MGTYGEYCPIAVGVDLIGDRWTPIVLRELMLGGQGFNEIHRGMPRCSRTLLSQRLRQLQARGIVQKRSAAPGRQVEYSLTPAGEDLTPILLGIGQWAIRWAFDDPTEEQLDAIWLLWHMHKYVDVDAIPDGRTCVEFDLRGPGGATGWLLLDGEGSTVCQVDPGFEVDVLVRADNGTAHRWFLGRITLDEARSSGGFDIAGPPSLVRAFPTWFGNPFREDVAAARSASRERIGSAAG